MLKKIITAVTGFCLALNTGTLTVFAEENEQTKFDAFMEEELKDTLAQDYLTMHYSVKDWKSMGIEKPELNFGEIGEDVYEENIEENNKVLAKLKTFDYDSLSETQKHDYDAIAFVCETGNAINQYPQLDFLFGPSGLQDNLITNFTEFVFYEKEDFDDYLTVLATVPEYLEEAVELTQEQASKGYFMSDGALEDTKTSISSFISKKEDNQLIETFNEAVEGFSGLSAEEKKSYEDRNRDLVINGVIPAYQKTSEQLEALRGSRSAKGGVSSFENGKEYYLAKARNASSMSGSVQDMLDACTEYLQNAVEEIIVLMRTNSDDPFFTSQQVSFQGPDQILEHLKDHLDDYPEVADLSYEADYLDPSVTNSTVMAYYVNNPIDDYSRNRIKINQSAMDNANTLYITLAHEGMPGHLYQFNYYHSTNPAPLREIISMTGYSEGWAMYAETHALEYSGLEEAAAKYTALNEGVGYVLDAAVDLMYNGLGYDETRIARYVEDLGLNSQAVGSLISFVADRPTLLLSYGVGLANFANLRRQAESRKGSSFNVKEFNKVLLDNGPRTFEAVQRDVNAWITGKPADEVETEPEIGPEEKEDQEVNWVLYGGIGAAIAALGVVSFIFWIRSRKDDPFSA
jgi:uncharacterized protein (DUF885 family)